MLDYDEISRVLDDITESYLKGVEYISVGYTADEYIEIGVGNLSALKNSEIPEDYLLKQDTKSDVKIPIIIREAPEIIESIGDFERDPIHEDILNAQKNSNYRVQGGDPCGNEKLSGYGTLSFTANSAGYEIKGGRCNGRKCSVSPALLSNNHVIALSDAGNKGDRIWVGSIDRFGTLECFVPFSCWANVDIAFGKTIETSRTDVLTIRNIGKIASFARPHIYETVRKTGARTGTTQGHITAQLHINVNGYQYRNVFRTTRGFACSGDSGSAVIGDNMGCIGIHAWGDKVDSCERDRPRGYFFTLIDPGKLSDFAIQLAE